IFTEHWKNMEVQWDSSSQSTTMSDDDDSYDSNTEDEILYDENDNCESMQVDNSDNDLKETELDNIPTLTSALIEKLQEAITQSYSLRSLQKLLLAFRAAAHINDSEENRYSYKISDPAGNFRVRTENGKRWSHLQSPS
ncbi:15098_t:CDS:2, partial [Cetraspora pellucida]